MGYGPKAKGNSKGRTDAHVLCYVEWLQDDLHSPPAQVVLRADTLSWPFGLAVWIASCEALTHDRTSIPPTGPP